jgi:hypothetical protein
VVTAPLPGTPTPGASQTVIVTGGRSSRWWVAERDERDVVPT